MEKDLLELEEARRRLVGAHEALSRDLEALLGITGVGEATALLVLSEAGDTQSYPDAQSYAAAAGLNPCRKESGTWKGRTGISKCGSRTLRSGLYLAASVASRHNPLVRAYRENLLARGKPKKQALVACMRKLLMICYGVLKAVRNGKTPFYGPPKQTGS